MPVIPPRNSAEALLSSPALGTASWWQRLATLGTPVVEPQADAQRVRVTFLWRDPHGDEQRSPIRRVYIDVNGVTDHHSVEPQSLQRLAGTDVWRWSVEVEAAWRGSYSLIPVTAEQLPPAFSADDAQRSRQQRQWWISLFPHAIADPLNLYPPYGGNKSQSAAHMPAAPAQEAWRAWDAGRAAPAAVTRLNWRSARLGDERRVWLYASGESAEPAQRPLIVVLDGRRWVEELSLCAALDAETAQGRLPAAVWLFIDAVDGERRERDLPCNADFWLAVQRELLPLAASHSGFSDDPHRTLVVGQSYGGLSAMYAALHWPERFGRVLTQSGSFWWPNLQLMTRFEQCESLEPGWLVSDVRRRGVTDAPLVIFQEAGDREADIRFVNQQMNQALAAAGHRVNFRIYAGGHDPLCWRGGLIDGLRWLLADDTTDRS